jgi:dihydrofolate synthase/folylpolyglutamate synthase
VVTRPDKVCIITDIGLDHTKVLGDTLPEIAYQKAGIIHNQNAVFMNKQSIEVQGVIKRTTEENNGILTVIDQQASIPPVGLSIFQKRNFTLAYHVVQATLERDHHDALQPGQISGASQVYIPGRMEVVDWGGKTIVLDGSHNEQKMSALVGSMKQRFAGEDLTILVSFGSNKVTSVIASLELLLQLGTTIIITEFEGGQDELRTPIEANALAEHAKEAGFSDITVEKDPIRALELLRQDSHEVGLITGSFYLLHQIRRAIFSTK